MHMSFPLLFRDLLVSSFFRDTNWGRCLNSNVTLNPRGCTNIHCHFERYPLNLFAC